MPVSQKVTGEMNHVYLGEAMQKRVLGGGAAEQRDGVLIIPGNDPGFRFGAAQVRQIRILFAVKIRIADAQQTLVRDYDLSAARSR